MVEEYNFENWWFVVVYRWRNEEEKREELVFFSDFGVE